MNKQTIKRATRRRNSIRQKSTRARLSIYRSHLNIYAQVIDDSIGQTLAQASTLDTEYKTLKFTGTGKEIAYKIGEMVAKRALAAGVTEVVYDKGPYAYHGRVAELANGARAAGLNF